MADPVLVAVPPAGMNVTQVGIWLSFIIVPGLLTLLPATKAAVLWSVSFTQQALLQTWGSAFTFPTLHLGPLVYLLSPLASCYAAGMISASCLGVRPKHIELLRDAVRSADAYFRLAAARQPQGISPSSRAGDAGRSGAAGPSVPQYGGSVFASSSSLTLEQDLSESEGEDSSSYEASSTASTGQVAADAFKTLSMVRAAAGLAELAYPQAVLDSDWHADGPHALALQNCAAYQHEHVALGLLAFCS